MSNSNPKLNTSNTPLYLCNVGNNKMVVQLLFYRIVETNHIKAKKNYLPLQPGDVAENTYADISDLSKDFNFYSKVSLKEGVENLLIGTLIFYKERKYNE